MEEELKELISDFKEALFILEEAKEHIDIQFHFGIKELLFRQKKRDKDSILEEVLDVFDSLKRSQDEVKLAEKNYYELRDEVYETVNKHY